MHHVIDLDLKPHEASGLVPCRSARLREALELDPLYWTVLDDGPVERCLALIGQVAGTREPTAGWCSRHLHASIATPTGKTDDGEALAWHDGWVYVFGSSYGAKDGPLQAARGFVARLHEDDVRISDKGRIKADLHVTADPFVLHQIVNEALVQNGIPLMAWSPRYRRHMVAKARAKALKKHRHWAWRLGHDDTPINIEGAAFTHEGHLLLGLRVPVTRNGEALVVEIRHPDRLFDPAAADPEPGRVFIIKGFGSRQAPVGIRDLHLEIGAGELHALIGNLDSKPDKSLLLQLHPEAAVAESAHIRVTLPSAPKSSQAKTARAVVELTGTLVHHFDGLYRVEGIAADAEGRFLYVSDEDNTVRTRFFTSGEATILAAE